MRQTIIDALASEHRKEIQNFDSVDAALIQILLSHPHSDPGIYLCKVRPDLAPHPNLYTALNIIPAITKEFENVPIVRESISGFTRRKIGEILVYRSPLAKHIFLRQVYHLKDEERTFYQEKLLCLSPTILKEYLNLLG